MSRSYVRWSWGLFIAAVLMASCKRGVERAERSTREGTSSSVRAQVPSTPAGSADVTSMGEGSGGSGASAGRTSTSSGPSVSGAASSLGSGAPSRDGGSSSVHDACPQGMRLVPAGEYWIGSPGTAGPPDEHPRFRTRVAAFCMDETEVTTEAFTACVAAGDCSVQQKPQLNCNYGRPGRERHPMNCVTWQQAVEFCKAHGARLPTEVEWEVAARGGTEYRAYSWGDEPPSVERTCWKRPRSCPVGQFPEGAFGLKDMIGNVWEWTSSNHGKYPWPPEQAPHKIYRGGSWSRRFDKWMSPTLRNRWGPERWGSHLGFRCAQLAERARCAYGKPLDDGSCPHGVEDVECPPKQAFNGARCAKEGAPQCPSGATFTPGWGCIRPRTFERHLAGTGDGTAGVTMTRSPRFDPDCEKHQASRPKAYRLEGGTHEGRNLVGQSRGCKNRDVGVGWNSACCP